MLPLPRIGDVILYSYLWQSEHLQGLEEGRKDRPCAVLLSVETSDGTTEFVVLPITHSPPHPGREAVEIPAITKQRLGLDAERSWLVLDEANRFVWPGPDIRPFDGPNGSTVSLGTLPPKFFAHVRTRFVELARARKATMTLRTN
jgi:hypothetical protein